MLIHTWGGNIRYSRQFVAAATCRVTKVGNGSCAQLRWLDSCWCGNFILLQAVWRVIEARHNNKWSQWACCNSTTITTTIKREKSEKEWKWILKRWPVFKDTFPTEIPARFQLTSWWSFRLKRISKSYILLPACLRLNICFLTFFLLLKRKRKIICRCNITSVSTTICCHRISCQKSINTLQQVSLLKRIRVTVWSFPSLTGEEFLDFNHFWREKWTFTRWTRSSKPINGCCSQLLKSKRSKSWSDTLEREHSFVPDQCHGWWKKK